MTDNDAASNSTRRSRLFRCVPVGYITLVSVFLGLVGLVLVTILHKPPQGPDIRLLSLHVSHFSASNSQLRGTYHVIFKMENPNKDISLEEFRVSIFHGKVELARTMLQETIPLKRTKEKYVKVSMATKAPKLAKKVFAELQEEWSRRVLHFNVKLQVTVGFGAADSSPKLFNLTCGQLRVFRSGKRKDPGRLMGIGGGKNHCVVDITGQE